MRFRFNQVNSGIINIIDEGVIFKPKYCGSIDEYCGRKENSGVILGILLRRDWPLSDGVGRHT